MPVEVIVSQGITRPTGTFLPRTPSCSVRGRVSIGDDPVGKLVCEQVIPFDSIPKELWLQFPDMETYQSGEQRLLTSLRSSEGRTGWSFISRRRGPRKSFRPTGMYRLRPGFWKSWGGDLGEKNVKSRRKRS